jgi:carboxypeptidase Q
MPTVSARLASLLLLVPLGFPVAAQGRDPAVDAMVELARKEPRVQEHLVYLTERIGPRLTSSPNLTRACQWARARFETFGLRAWLEEWGTFPVGFERGPSTGGMVAPVEMPYAFTTNAWTAGTPGPVRARAVLEPRSLEDLEARRGELAGAWVVDRPRRERPRRSEREEVDAALAKLSIAGRVRDAGGELLYAFGDHEIDWTKLPTEVSINLLQSQYRDLLERLQRAEQAAEATDEKVAPIELEFDIDNRFLPGPVPLYNVIAELPGTELGNEFVVLGGHIDSWDPAKGAQDNGTGIATTLEAARLLSAVEAKPKRTIRFMLWSGEEQGLLGSAGYVKAHPDEMGSISAVFVHDEGTNYLSGLEGPKALVPGLRLAFEPVLALDSTKPFTIEENEGLSPFGGSDHGSFIAAGVPAFSWEQTGRTSYFKSWHTQHDTLEFVVDEYQQHSALVAAVGALGVANLPEKLDRTDLIREREERPPRRRMGVQLEGAEVTEVIEGSKAEAAGWQEGDVIVSIDGVEVADQRAILRELQKGGPQKKFALKRGEATVETVLDYTGEPSEARAEEAAVPVSEPAKKE